MFEHKVPLFNPAPLSKEILSAMRDLALYEQAVRYAEYSDGILYGCGLYEKNMNIGVNPGLVKFGGKVYILTEANAVAYKPTEHWAVLKIRFGKEEKNRDFLRYTGKFVIDENTAILPNEMELGRFKLKQGSNLRTEYVDFQDMTTEYDTVNLIGIPHAGIGEATISPIILKTFAREAFPFAEGALDISFCCTCLSRDGVMSHESICQYIWKRLDLRREVFTNADIHRYLALILLELKGLEDSLEGQDDSDGILLL